jgi:pimeloyl-ACP methyl ester carboxylesterase
VLLVHGWSGRGAQMGAFVEPLVAAGHRVIAFDAPAHGRSSGTDTNLPEISAVMRALDRIHGPFRAVIAHSFGVVCTLYALHEGLRAARVVAISAPATLDGLVEKFTTGLAVPPGAVRVLRALIEARFGADVWARFSPLALARTVRAAALVMHDEDDADVPWRESETLANAWPGAQFLRTRGLGHRRILRESEVINQVARFVTRGAIAPASKD